MKNIKYYDEPYTLEEDLPVIQMEDTEKMDWSGFLAEAGVPLFGLAISIFMLFKTLEFYYL